MRGKTMCSALYLLLNLSGFLDMMCTLMEVFSYTAQIVLLCARYRGAIIVQWLYRASCM